MSFGVRSLGITGFISVCTCGLFTCILCCIVISCTFRRSPFPLLRQQTVRFLHAYAGEDLRHTLEELLHTASEGFYLDCDILLFFCHGV